MVLNHCNDVLRTPGRYRTRPPGGIFDNSRARGFPAARGEVFRGWSKVLPGGRETGSTLNREVVLYSGWFPQKTRKLDANDNSAPVQMSLAA